MSLAPLPGPLQPGPLQPGSLRPGPLAPSSLVPGARPADPRPGLRVASRDGDAEPTLAWLLEQPERPVAVLSAVVSNAGDLLERFGTDGLEQVLSTLGERLRRGCAARVLRVSPLGGLVFTVPSPAEPSPAGDPALAAITGAEESLRDFVEVGGEQAWPVVSLGVRRVGARDEAAQLLRDARSALVRAQQESPGTTTCWPAGRTGSDLGRLRLVDDLVGALRQHPEQLALAYQPVVDLTTGEVGGVEALLRWTHPERGAVSPLVAVAAAERSGLVRELGLLVVDRALAQLRAWQRPTPLTMHVNVSPLQLRAPGFVPAVARLLEQHDVRASALLLEITESAAMSGDPEVLAALDALGELGVRLGIDDFGTGYSSISRLQQLPVDTVKIDRSLVCEIGGSAPAFEMLRAVLGLLRTSPGLTIVAEGVETALQSAHLRALGCRWAQGYHLGRPVPPGDVRL